jgi:hypothetical protein
MDKTLSDYIKRMKNLEKKQTVAVNRNVWNEPELANQDIYNVYPEQKNDEDKKINPYGQH